MFGPNDNSYGNPRNQSTQNRQGMPPMVIAAVACAVISIFFITTGTFSLIFGALAILFSFLARGGERRAVRPALVGRFIGLATVVISVILIMYSMTVMVRQYGSLQNYYNAYITTIEETYGIELEEWE